MKYNWYACEINIKLHKYIMKLRLSRTLLRWPQRGTVPSTVFATRSTAFATAVAVVWR